MIIIDKVANIDDKELTVCSTSILFCVFSSRVVFGFHVAVCQVSTLVAFNKNF